MKETLIKTKDLAIEFSLATKHKDTELLHNLLSEDGSFTIQDQNRETIIVNKQKFMEWYLSKLDNATITDVDFDQCLHCMIGNKVVLFNRGLFPITFKDSWERSKVGLMLELEGDKISGISFCRVFLRTTNKPVFECMGEKIKEYMAQGLTTKEAIKKSSTISPADLI